MNRTSLIAPCGMNCGICMAYLRKKARCPGCRVEDPAKAVSILRCKIMNCPEIRSGKIRYCFGCRSFPCANLRHLDKRYRTKYHMSMVENLVNIRKHGIREFVRKEAERWACPGCGGVVCVHRGFCYTCGLERWKKGDPACKTS